MAKALLCSVMFCSAVLLVACAPAGVGDASYAVAPANADAAAQIQSLAAAGAELQRSETQPATWAAIWQEVQARRAPFDDCMDENTHKFFNAPTEPEAAASGLAGQCRNTLQPVYELMRIYPGNRTQILDGADRVTEEAKRRVIAALQAQ
jgi:hypothetical protein